MGERLSEPSKQLVGMDTSREVLASAREKYPELTFKRGDVLRDPMGTLTMVRELQGANSGSGPSNLCVFVDIGGNRELEALAALQLYHKSCS